MKFNVCINLSGKSVFGEWKNPCKGRNGKVLIFTQGEAEAYVKKMNEGLTNKNVSYTIEEHKELTP